MKGGMDLTRPLRVVGQFGTEAVDAFLQARNRADDGLGRGLDLAGQRLHGLGNDREAAAGFTGMLGLDRGIEGHQPGLQRNLGDLGGRVRHLGQGGGHADHFGTRHPQCTARPLHRRRALGGGCRNRRLGLADLLQLLRQGLHGLALQFDHALRVVQRTANLGRVLADRRDRTRQPPDELQRGAAVAPIGLIAMNDRGRTATLGPTEHALVPASCSGSGCSRPVVYQSRSLTRSLAIDCVCNWHTLDSVTLSTAAISLRFMSCS
mmetsp:Transcript_49471/g.82718  ORF Transcript_49471/g.82718 Transcript_49471/m.82718 type:complete len:264 (-) Transcript_49471:694-1485(-)